ncbi:NAD(P)-binding domain-containing protein [uncultured Litoreibacter sp.]|uniref:flavin-containing monooxygenase n=1 Tax=uncultured Litoreibacter sp. TaxID=1392394 RepID=UPI00261DB51B|nr:NAD(P)-binding domain-containing protein [uncultured Litoreibacter sp.]
MRRSLLPLSREVIIIGAGPSGLAAARWLLSRGFSPRIYEAHSQVGGQWSWTNPRSGVWPQMVSNTYRDATRFSDLNFPDRTPIFPHNSVVRDYFESFANKFGILDLIQFGTSLRQLRRGDTGWELELDRDGTQLTDTAPYVVVATGRFNAPVIPDIPGAENMSGELGLIHAFNYKSPKAYQDKRVAVLGGSISSLEIASDLSMLGAASVHLCQRRQRYVNPKMFLGVPIEYRLFTYERGRLALDDPDALMRDSEAKVMEHAGDPSNYGTPKPHPDFAKAGATGSQHYLNLVAEGRVHPLPWPKEIDGTSIRFADGRAIEVDGIIAGTGYQLSLPFLSADIAATLNLSDTSIDLDSFTFHPDLPGLAFMGLWSQAGSYPTPIEQQARFLAYTWSGQIPRPVDTMREGLLDCVREGHQTMPHSQAEMALRFARLCGTDPLGETDEWGAEQIKASPTTSMLYRRVGPDRIEPAERMNDG